MSTEPKFNDPYRNAWWDHCNDEFKEYFDSLDHADQSYLVPTADGMLYPDEAAERWKEREENGWEDEVGCDKDSMF